MRLPALHYAGQLNAMSGIRLTNDITAIRSGGTMADNIVLEKITFYKVDDDGNPLLNSKGVERVFTLKDDIDCSWICEATDAEHLKEIK